ncbi:SUKH-3 domain-containing protein [Actinomycetes bacterium KLBMP 9797]
MSERFTPAVEAALRAAGWHPGRRLSPDRLAEYRRAVARPGLLGGRLWTAIGLPDRVLEEFGGLVLEGGAGVDLNPRPFALDPTMAAHSVDTLIDAGRALGTPLIPLGVEGLDEAVLALTDQGEVLAIDPIGEWSLGATIEEALDTLVTGRHPRPATPAGDRRPAWLAPSTAELAEAGLVPRWSLKRPVGAAFYLPRSPANLYDVWLPDTLTRMGIVPTEMWSVPGHFEAGWGDVRCEIQVFDLEFLTVVLVAFEQPDALDQLASADDSDPPVAQAFRAACTGLTPDLEVAFLHISRAPDLVRAAVEQEYHVVTIDGEPLLDQGFAALYLNDQTDYGVDPALAAEPRAEMPIAGGRILLGGTGEQRWS